MFKRFIKPVYAHCDVPCGIYETDSMTHASATVKRMTQIIIEVEDPNSIAGQNTIGRAILTKEKHAQKCKDELYLLWSDYFKPQHLEAFPDLHDKFWMAAKQCAKVKQTVDIAECDKLTDMVHDIAHMFIESKK